MNPALQINYAGFLWGKNIKEWRKSDAGIFPSARACEVMSTLTIMAAGSHMTPAPLTLTYAYSRPLFVATSQRRIVSYWHSTEPRLGRLSKAVDLWEGREKKHTGTHGVTVYVLLPGIQCVSTQGQTCRIVLEEDTECRVYLFLISLAMFTFITSHRSVFFFFSFPPTSLCFICISHPSSPFRSSTFCAWVHEYHSPEVVGGGGGMPSQHIAFHITLF